MKKLLSVLGKGLWVLFILGGIYILTICFPQPFFKNKFSVGNVTVFSNENIPLYETKKLVKKAIDKIKKSTIYKEDVRYRVFIVNNPWLWRYFSNKNNKAAALNYVFITNIFFRKVDIKKNHVYGNSGQPAGGDRTFDYFLAHEMTHSLEFYSMPWYKYPINTNWLLEGYSEYIGHNSETYEQALKRYLTFSENKGEKYYTRVRTMVAYLLEKEKIAVPALWSKFGEYDAVLKRAIPDDKPKKD